MKFVLEIELGNEAMQTPDDVAFALAKIVENCRNDCQPWEENGQPIRDINGNTVGKWEVS